MRKGYVYYIRNTVTNKWYVGFTAEEDPDTRLSKHWRDLNADRHCNKYLQRAYNKYGKESFTAKVEHTFDCYKTASDFEIDIIKENHGKPHCYNIMKGKYNVDLTSNERSEEFKDKISKIKKGCIPWNKGLKHSEETKRKISEKAKQRSAESRIVSEEGKEKVSEGLSKYWSSLTKEERSKRNGNSGAKGIKQSKESNKKRSETMKRFYEQKRKLKPPSS